MPSRWTHERKVAAAEAAPRDRVLVHPDTRIVERPGWFQVITPSARGYLNEIGLSALESDEVDAAIDAAIATYHPSGTAVKWVVGPWTRPADMAERLAARGFAPHELSAMGASTAASFEAPARVEVRRVADEDELDVFADVSVRGYGMGADTAAAHRGALAAALAAEAPRVALWVARLGGVAVGNAALIVGRDHGYLIGGLVLPEARGQGIYRALVAARMAALAALGVEYAVTHAVATTSAPILARLGFEALYPSTVWSLPPP